MNVILIGGVLLALVIFFLKFKGFKHSFFSFVVIFLALFLIISIVYVYSTSRIDLSSVDGLMQGGKVYLSWLGETFHNTKQITAYVVNQDWGAGNSSLT